jgi:hypothetical protein
MENYKTTTNCNIDKGEKMALDLSYPKETHWIHRGDGTRSEPSGGSKAQPSQRELEEDGRGRSHGNGEDVEQG